MPLDHNVLASLVENALQAIDFDPQEYQPDTPEKFEALCTHLTNEEPPLPLIDAEDGMEYRTVLLATLLGPRSREDGLPVGGGLPEEMAEDVLTLLAENVGPMSVEGKIRLAWNIAAAYGLGWRRSADLWANGAWEAIWPRANDALINLVRPGVKAMRKALTRFLLAPRGLDALTMEENLVLRDAQFVATIFASVYQDPEGDLRWKTSWNTDSRELVIQRADESILQTKEGLMLTCLGAHYSVIADGGKIAFRVFGANAVVYRESDEGILGDGSDVLNGALLAAFIGGGNALTVTFPPNHNVRRITEREEYFVLQNVTSCEVASCECGTASCRKNHSIHGWSPSESLADYVKNAVRGKHAMQDIINPKTIVTSIYWWVLVEKAWRGAVGAVGSVELPCVTIGDCAVSVPHSNNQHKYKKKKLIVFPGSESYCAEYRSCKAPVANNPDRQGQVEIDGRWRQIVIPESKIRNQVAPESLKSLQKEIAIATESSDSPRLCGNCPQGEENVHGPCRLGQRIIHLWNWNPFVMNEAPGD